MPSDKFFAKITWKGPARATQAEADADAHRMAEALEAANVELFPPKVIPGTESWYQKSRG